MKIQSPSTTALEYPTCSSNVEPELIRRLLNVHLPRPVHEAILEFSH
jgi:hypothetical protein